MYIVLLFLSGAFYLFGSVFGFYVTSDIYASPQVLKEKEGVWQKDRKSQSSRLILTGQNTWGVFQFPITMRVPMHVAVCLGLSVEGE